MNKIKMREIKRSMAAYLLASIFSTRTAWAPATRISRFLGISRGFLANAASKAAENPLPLNAY
jgi:hypothetical protein